MRNLQAFMDRHNIRHSDLAFLTGCTTRSVYNWVEGRRPLPRSAELLLMALDQKKISEKWLAENLKQIMATD